MRLARQVFACVLLFGADLTFAHSRVGEQANYALNRARARTSAIVQAGAIGLKINEELKDDTGLTFYNTQYDYDLTVAFMGRRQGSGVMKAKDEYFDGAFLARLRDEGEIKTEAFHARYLGQSDVTTRAGQSYSNCDLIELYDIKVDKIGGGFLGFVTTMLMTTENSLHALATHRVPPVENLRVKAALKQGEVPVIGAVRVDVAAEKNGLPVKAGFDYEPNAGQGI